MAVTWDASFDASPAGSANASTIDDKIRELKEAILERVGNEHTEYVDDSTLGAYTKDWRHRPGSAVAYYQVAEPTAQPGSSGAALGADDAGRIWIDSDDNSLYVYDGAAFVNVPPTPTGVISMYGGSVAPSGYLLCDGSAVSRATYAALFAVVGISFGPGDGITTFNLPDFRGLFPRGAGTNGSLTDALGVAFSGGVVGEAEEDTLQGHIHGLNGLDSLNLLKRSGSNGDENGSPDYNDYLNVRVTGVKTDATYGTARIGAETKPASLSVSFIIKT